ncbi:NME7, partial [Symbiodinium pilosum]
YDTKSKRLFLKRGVYDQDGAFRLEDLFIGAELTVCARKLKIVSYGDVPTRSLFDKNGEQVYTVIGGAAHGDLGNLFTAAHDRGFTIKRVKTLPSGDMSVHVELVGQGGVETWREAVNATLSEDAARAVHVDAAGLESEKVFASKECSATFDSCSLCIVRPHAVREGKVGSVISAILNAGLQISAMQTFVLLKSQAENFYEVYKTVLPSAQYASMITELASGLCLAMEVRGDNVVPRLRELCGPFDIEIAKHLRPNTIRACHGRNNVHNVVHCTDLAEERRMVLLGVDNAGKTTTLEKLKSLFGLKGMVIAVFWDLGGHASFRSVWHNYYSEVQGVMFIVDSADPTRIEESKATLVEVISHDKLKGVPLLCLANKQDKPEALSIQELSRLFEFERLFSERPFHVHPCCALQGQGLEAGVRWLLAEADKFARSQTTQK